MNIFARKLRERARDLQLSHAEIARRCGLTERRFGHYVTGTREPDLGTLVRISNALDTTPNALLGVDDSPRRIGEAADLQTAISAGLAALSLPNLRVVKTMVDSMILQQRASRGRRSV